jgi:hypothetical protein
MITGRPNPYPGLRPFRGDESASFFGREVEIDNAIQTLSTHSLVTICGASGCGKSSFVQAGLIPTLLRTVDWDATAECTPILLNPGSKPIHNLVRALGSARQLRSHANLNDRNVPSSTSLMDLFPELPNPPILVVDRFEEAFRLGNEEATHFVRLLLSAASTRRTKLVLVMRAQDLSNAANFPGLPEAINTTLYLLRELTSAQLLQAIVGPLRNVGAEVEQALVTRVIEDMAKVTIQGDQLPLMQHALNSAWKDAVGTDLSSPVTLTLSNYERIGGVADSLHRSAEGLFFRLSADQRRICWRLFRALAGRDDRGDLYCCPAKPIDEIASIAVTPPEEVRDVAKVFRELGFLNDAPGADQAEGLEISHEAIFRNWRRLARWMDDESILAQQYRNLVLKARDAGIGKRAEPRLLIRTELNQAVQFLRDPRVSSSWANQYGSKSDFICVTDYISVSKDRSPRSLSKILIGLLMAERTMPSRRNIFICYRRDDGAHPADRIFERLQRAFPTSTIFYDVRSTTPGIDFKEKILKKISECAVVIVVIGNHWLETRHDDGPRKGERRIDDPDDIVRIEIETALEQEVRIIPVLVGTRKMPAKFQLQPSLQDLTSRDAFDLPAGVEFTDRLAKLVSVIRELIPSDRVVDKLSSWFGAFANRRN